MMKLLVVLVSLILKVNFIMVMTQLSMFVLILQKEWQNFYLVLELLDSIAYLKLPMLPVLNTSQPSLISTLIKKLTKFTSPYISTSQMIKTLWLGSQKLNKMKNAHKLTQALSLTILTVIIPPLLSNRTFILTFQSKLDLLIIFLIQFIKKISLPHKDLLLMLQTS